MNGLWFDPSELIYLPFSSTFLRFIVHIYTQKNIVQFFHSHFIHFFCFVFFCRCSLSLWHLTFSLDFPLDLICMRISVFYALSLDDDSVVCFIPVETLLTIQTNNCCMKNWLLPGTMTNRKDNFIWAVLQRAKVSEKEREKNRA